MFYSTGGQELHPRQRKGGAALIELLFGLARALGLILRHAGLGGARGAKPQTVPGLGEGGGEAAENEQDNSKGQPDPPHRGGGSHMLSPTQQETQNAESGDGDADSDEGFGRYRGSL